MDLVELEKLLRLEVGDLEGRPGNWRTSIEDVPVQLLASDEHDRIRIISPAVDVGDEPDVHQLTRVLEANFTTALDVRYALYGGTLWAAYLHPLTTLTRRDLIDGINQVVRLVKTTGTSYSSSDLRFGVGEAGG